MGLQKTQQKISVIAPCLNEEKHLPTFLNSLKHQTFRNFEVIIVDGGSTDQSINIIDGYRKHFSIVLALNQKRNFGALRNFGARFALGHIQFHGSVDTYLEPDFLQKLNKFYEDPNVISVAGRTYPLGTSIIAHVSYQLFDLLRFTFTCFPSSFRKYRPSGNFTSVRTSTLKEVGGYPEVTVNEDGLFGQKLDCYARQNKKCVVFSLKLYVGHHVKKFESMGGLRAVMFYAYAVTNLFPMLKPLLKTSLVRAGQVFEGNPTKQKTIKELVKDLWDWL